MSQSFSRDKRLCSSADFKQVFDTTDIKVSSQQLLILAKANVLGQARLGLVVAKKNIRTAVGRNRAKRHIRETFRLKQDEIGDLDIVVLVRRGFHELTDSEQNQLLNKQWQRLKRKRSERQQQA
ncbi:ribonuclease P protein component [Endozoicomonas ascidiicola]|uniref:ribonuclease P protein component n=1 Tax=Endozoicomonas ascidiicola TaxID=1698521 RepID=UPI0008351AF8|nr:ribonuclease P protein component [Endozoicomonas ascidiicola]